MIKSSAQLFTHKQNHGVISAIVLTYRQPAFLFDTIDSILSQSYPYIELIISDDGTEDFNSQLLQDYIESHKKNNLISYEIRHNDTNLGTVKNINKAICCSKGEFIKIIGGDDLYYDENVFQNQIDYLNCNPDVLLVTGKASECDEQLNTIYKMQSEKTNKVLDHIFELEPKEYFDKCSKEGLFPIATQAICFRRSFFELYGLYDERYVLLEDTPMEKRIIINRVPIGTINNYTVIHRASVGISSNKEFFSKKRSQYYLDMTNYVRNELLTRPQYFPKFRTWTRYRTERYRYLMSVSKTRMEKAKITITHLDTVFWMAIFRPERLKEKINIILKKDKKAETIN